MKKNKFRKFGTHFIDYTTLIISKMNNGLWLGLIALGCTIAYFVVLSLYVIHSKQYPGLLTALLVLIAVYLLISIVFFFRYAHLCKKILWIKCLDKEQINFEVLRNAQYEILSWIIGLDISCLILFIISNILSVQVSHFQNYFTLGFLLVFFFSSISQWILIVSTARKNSTPFSLIYQYFIATFENEPELIKSTKNFTILCQCSGFKYTYLEKIMDATYWVANFMWIYIISALIGTSFTTGGSFEIVIPIIDLLSYFGPYLFLFYVHSMMMNEKGILGSFKLLRVNNEAYDGYLYQWLMNIKKHFLTYSVYYKQENIFYWCINEKDEDLHPQLNLLFRGYKYLKISFKYSENTSAGNINTINITNITSDFNVIKLQEPPIFSLNNLFSLPILVFFILSKVNAVKFYYWLKKFNFKINTRQFVIDNLNIFKNAQVYLQYDKQKHELFVSSLKKLKKDPNPQLHEVLFITKKRLSKVIHSMYDYITQPCINPLFTNNLNNLPKQTFICIINNYQTFFGKIKLLSENFRK